MLCFGKKAQACGVMAGPRLDEVKDNCFRLPGRINSTWGGNFTDYSPFDALLTASSSRKDSSPTRGAKVKKRVFGRLCNLSRPADMPFVHGAPCGRGLMLASICPDPATRDAFWQWLLRDSDCLSSARWRTLNSIPIRAAQSGARCGKTI